MEVEVEISLATPVPAWRSTCTLQRELESEQPF